MMNLAIISVYQTSVSLTKKDLYRGEKLHKENPQQALFQLRVRKFLGD